MSELFAYKLETKHCPICTQVLAVSEFGVCRARKDGRNLYCRSCIRKKVTESRRALKAYKSIRDQYPPTRMVEAEARPSNDNARNSTVDQVPYATRQPNRMTPAERVREAIRKGARTQKQIGQGTKLGNDEVGDALANLLLWTKEIRTEVVDNNRMYFINEAVPEHLRYRDEDGQQLPARKRDVPSSFSAVSDLMPGKKAEAERAPGWVAA